MRDKILKTIKENPKHYSLIIKKDIEMSSWIKENSLIIEDHYPEMIYSALKEETNICKYGNKKYISRISEGWVCCGPANKCKCTKENISNNVSKTKLLVSDEDNKTINGKREETMKEKFGVAFSFQRPEVKKILSKPKISDENFELLNNKEWLYKEYIENEKSLTEIASNLNVYYGTVGEYCRKHGFTIRQRTNSSIQEKEICEFINSLNINYIQGDWETLGSKEIDIYIPEYKFGIELNGLYWHSYNPNCTHTPKIENKTKHIDKTNLAKTNEIDLIQITDYEWINKTEIIKSIIKTKIGLSNKLYARKFILKDVPKNIERDFLNQNHLQGYIPSSKAIGLYLNDELYMLMTFGKSRYNKNADIELLRLCTKLNYIVIGGTQKLFKKARELYKDKTIISYCDMSKFNGTVYRTIGFVTSTIISPGYFWTDGTNIFSRFKCQKSQLQKWLATYDAAKSESENMFSAGYRRYWDCGQCAWIQNL